MARLRDMKSQKLEQAVGRKFAASIGPFDEVAQDDAAAERTGYSNYSYWGSTLRVFLKKKVAVCLLCVLLVLLVFTFIQPLLPEQYPANFIIDHPITRMQMSNVPPSLTTVVAQVAEGTELVVVRKIDDAWYAVSTAVATVQRRQAITVDEYLGDWVHVQYENYSGYIINDFTTKLKLPENPEAVPYEVTSNFPVTIRLMPDSELSGDLELFIAADSLRLAEGGATGTTVGEAELRILPTTIPFRFGTNNAGQDLWSLVWSGTRTSLYIGFMVAVVEALIGMLIGVLWGYVRALDRILTEIYNVVDNIPTTIVLILFSYIMRPSVSTLIFVMCITGWVGMARFIRNQIVIIRDRDYNLASRCLGTGTFRIIARNLLPYLVSVIMLRMALAVPAAIGNEVFITYIGLGLPVSIPSLGNLINVGRKLISTSQSYQLIFPTIVLSIVTISFYIIGNAFADAADPHNHV